MPSLRLPAVPTTKVSWDGNLDSASSLTRSEDFVQTGNVKEFSGSWYCSIK